MTSALQIARSGLDALDQKMKAISNNLANVNTTAFKKDRASFETLMYQSARSPGDPSGTAADYAVGLGTGTGVRVSGSERIHAQGSLTQTDNALDLAIEGSGFFVVTRADGTTAYTRDGAFKLNAEGQLVMGNGDRLTPGIAIPDGAQAIVIATDGTVSVTLPGQAAASAVGLGSCSSSARSSVAEWRSTPPARTRSIALLRAIIASQVIALARAASYW